MFKQLNTTDVFRKAVGAEIKRRYAAKEAAQKAAKAAAKEAAQKAVKKRQVPAKEAKPSIDRSTSTR